MLNATQWWRQWTGAERPWLILENGETIARLDEFDISPYATLAMPGIDHHIKVDAAFVTAEKITDETLLKSLAAQTHFLLVPESLGTASLTEAVRKSDTLTSLDHHLRLISYPQDAFQGAPPDLTDTAQALWLLAWLGARNIRTLGVDYGFAPTPEANQKRDCIAAAIQKFGLFSGPLTCEVPARIYIGTDSTQDIGAKILEYTVRKHATLTTEFDSMYSVQAPTPRDPANQPRTEFSFNRFAIPKLAGYHGRAMYVDADMMVFGDLRELWEMPFGDATVMFVPPSHPSRSKQTSVMLMDCNRVTWDLNKIVQDLDDGKYGYGDLMREMVIEPPGSVQDSIPVDWNMLEEYRPGKTRLLHYTDMQKQPWVSRKNKLDYLWLEEFQNALNDGFITQDEYKQALRDGILRPSLPKQLKQPPSKMSFFRSFVAPLLDLRHKPHQGLQTRLKSLKGGKP